MSRAGDTSEISFAPNSEILSYLKDGTQNGWQDLDDVRVENGTVHEIPLQMFVGEHDRE